MMSLAGVNERTNERMKNEQHLYCMHIDHKRKHMASGDWFFVEKRNENDDDDNGGESRQMTSSTTTSSNEQRNE